MEERNKGAGECGEREEGGEGEEKREERGEEGMGRKEREERKKESGGEKMKWEEEKEKEERRKRRGEEREGGERREGRKRRGKGREGGRGREFSCTVLSPVYVHYRMSVNLRSGWMKCIIIIMLAMLPVMLVCCQKSANNVHTQTNTRHPPKFGRLCTERG